MGDFARRLGFEGADQKQPASWPASAQVTFQSAPSGHTHWSVLLCKHEDYSGWAPSREAAIKRAFEIADRITCDKCTVASEPWPSETARKILQDGHVK